MSHKKKWDNTTYQTIKDAQLKEDLLTITFQNNDTVSVPLSSLLPKQEFKVLHIDLHHVEIKCTLPKTITIPWDKIRCVTDPAFAKEMIRKAEQQSKLIGKRLKELREARNIKSLDLAKLTDLAPQTISRIEQGHQDTTFSSLSKILAAMGCSLKDLIEP